MAKSDTICCLPFIAVDQRQDRRGPCCQAATQHWGFFSTIEEYWHSEPLAQLRQQMINHQRAVECVHCWRAEDAGQISMRQAVNLNRQHMIDLDQPRIKQVKLNTGNTCNISCMMCFDSVSSSYEKLWSTDPTWIMPENKLKKLSYDHHMQQYILDHAADIEVIEVLGGEPLFNKQFIQLAESLAASGAAEHMTMMIITNGTLLTQRLIDLFKKFKKTVFAVSVDGVGLVNDYQRWPSQFAEISENLNKINSHFDLSLLPTVTAVNIIGLTDLYGFALSKNYAINNIEPVAHWPQLNPSNLPDQLKKLVDSNFDYLIQGSVDTDGLLKFVSQWDRQRNIHIQNYMSEWTDIIT
jgi:sulfatase maturation enzyme AslB (radical SAM superfamily)